MARAQSPCSWHGTEEGRHLGTPGPRDRGMLMGHRDVAPGMLLPHQDSALGMLLLRGPGPRVRQVRVAIERLDVIREVDAVTGERVGVALWVLRDRVLRHSSRSTPYMVSLSMAFEIQRAIRRHRINRPIEVQAGDVYADVRVSRDHIARQFAPAADDITRRTDDDNTI